VTGALILTRLTQVAQIAEDDGTQAARRGSDDDQSVAARAALHAQLLTAQPNRRAPAAGTQDRAGTRERSLST
jgi:hypothetical protein